MTHETSIHDLIALMARLRDPSGGCPWDLQQTFRSILPYTLEEAYEVAEAIELEDMDALRDELGDLLLQVVFHARMAEEQGHFAFDDVVRSICDKMIRRHPHVFSETPIADADAVLANWEGIKDQERALKHDAAPPPLLAGIAHALPALVRAEKLQRRAARVGFDWEAIDGVFAKVAEELDECRESLTEPDPTRRVHEVGDLLFSCVNLARHMGVDAEQALRAANHRFERRFGQVEAGLRAQGIALGPDAKEAMETQWTLAKAAEQ